jgi:hypothetical protein
MFLMFFSLLNQMQAKINLQCLLFLHVFLSLSAILISDNRRSSPPLMHSQPSSAIKKLISLFIEPVQIEPRQLSEIGLQQAELTAVRLTRSTLQQ